MIVFVHTGDGGEDVKPERQPLTTIHETLESEGEMEIEHQDSQVVAPEEKSTIILDKMGDIIKQDAFFYPVHKNYSCFQELCEFIKNSTIIINSDVIIIWFGNGELFRLFGKNMEVVIQRLLASIWVKKPECQIFISTLFPEPNRCEFTSPAIMKFNEEISQLVNSWRQAGHAVALLESHLVFVTQRSWLNEKTGIFTETFTFNEPHRIATDFSKGRITTSEWFKLRKFWWEELLNYKFLAASLEFQDLRVHHRLWKSPTPVIELDESLDRD